MGLLLGTTAITLIVLAAGWNVMGFGRTLGPATERGATVLCLAMSIGAVWFADGLAESALAIVALLLSGFFLGLTFMSGLPRQQPAAVVGATAPDFAAVDAGGEPFRLSDLRGAPVLVKFFRGSWCPYCVNELRDFDALATRFASLGVRLVAIAPDRVDELATLAHAAAWKIRLVADPTNEVGRRYNVQNRNFTPKRGPYRELVIPTSILVDADGIVRWIDQASDFRRRTSAAVVLEHVRAALGGGGVVSAAIATPPTEECPVCA